MRGHSAAQKWYATEDWFPMIKLDYERRDRCSTESS
jgi:hypothetical protein